MSEKTEAGQSSKHAAHATTEAAAPDRAKYFTELKTHFDYAKVIAEIDMMTQKDNHKAPTVLDMLDQMKDSILNAHNKQHVTAAALVRKLAEHGLKVSEPTLRKYIQAHNGSKKVRSGKHDPAKGKPVPDSTQDTAPAEPKTAAKPASGTLDL